jgi:predicted nucleotidyltransferase
MDPLIILEKRGAITRLARRFDWHMVFLFGSAAKGSGGQDVDLAVIPRSVPGLLEEGGRRATLEALFVPRHVDLGILNERLSPLVRFEVFYAGTCLFEAQEGLFDREQDRAFFLYADSSGFRRASLEVLCAGLRREIMERTLSFLRQFVTDLF